MKNLPLARSTDIIVQTLGKEILVYDLITHKAFNLNETSTIVYQACDGKTTFAELSKRNNFTDDIIFLAIDELNKENLLENSEDYNSPFNGLSRREIIRKVGFASLIALPVISLLVAPTAAMAQSARALANGTACTASNQCASGTCGTGPCCQTSSGTCSQTSDCCSGGFDTCNDGRCCLTTGAVCTPNAAGSARCCSGVCKTSLASGLSRCT